MFGEAHGAKLGVRVPQPVEETLESSAELHGFGRSVVLGLIVGGSPVPGPGVAAQESWPAATLILDCGWGHEKFFEVAHPTVGQDHPKAPVDEIGHLFSEEAGVLGGGDVAASLDCLVFLFQSPRRGVNAHRDSFVSPLLK